METLTKAIVQAGWSNRILTEAQLARVLDGTPQRRYNLVNRALHRGELVRLRRARYMLVPRLAGQLPHPFVVAQALRPGSYVSLESALSYHGWIPEAVPLTLSVTHGRRGDEIATKEMGTFRYYPLALNRGYFLECVDRIVLTGQAALLAQPLRALLDRFCLHKQEWPGLDALRQGLRIEEEVLATIRAESLEPLRQIYKHQRMQRLIDQMQEEISK